MHSALLLRHSTNIDTSYEFEEKSTRNAFRKKRALNQRLWFLLAW